jgi:hypothetical protein
MIDESRMSQLKNPVESRRGLLNRFAGLSAGVFAALASRGTARIPAANYACCNLAFPGGPFCQSCGPACWTCPSGYHSTVWYCCSSGRLWGCGECQQGGGSNCEAGSHYRCSFPFRTGVPC